MQTVSTPNMTTTVVAGDPYGARHIVTSSDGCQLAYWVGGVPDGIPVVLLHGFSFDHTIWLRQWCDPVLQRQCRLIVPDLRGHGQSGRPAHASSYAQGRAWADDLAALIDACSIGRAVVVAWSYAGRMINDFIRHYGCSRLSGVNYVAAATLAVPAAIGPGHAWLADMCAHEASVASAAERALVHAALGPGASEEDLAAMLRVVRQTTPETRRWLRERVLDYDELLATLAVPALVTHGELDPIVLPCLTGRLASVLPDVEVSLYPHTGHAPFIDQPARFNHELAAFARRVWKDPSASVGETG
ncbi:alpha/beta fold hydrolase [Paraburkholderia sp. ZP32-5]|uniref:alpha/beta fold hydrolase n=1 Tax=Paraburkholderia sp. ZP32-5 TaxID=2883245 RepID=UPI001F25F342|nr:alpha/beta hydrolase [Paraburkholderia sp. ZP32-5]